MNTRRYPRTLADAFRTGPEYGCSIERPCRAGETMAGFVLALVIGIVLALSLVHWWSS